MMKVGIVGMPNAGKSSLFNALSQAGAQAANYPFTTIEPNVAVVGVEDERLNEVARVVRSSNVVPDTIEFHDIAGLVAGAHKGEGLGNQFLANIRETDALLHVVRAHDDPNVIHPEGRVDPAADMDTIETELIYADLEQAERRHARVVREARSGDRTSVAEEKWLQAAIDALQAGRPVRSVPVPDDAPNAARDLGALTAKPVLYVANVSEGDDDVPAVVAEHASGRDAAAVAISSRLEAELGELDDEEASSMREELGISESGLAARRARRVLAAEPDRVLHRRRGQARAVLAPAPRPVGVARRGRDPLRHPARLRARRGDRVGRARRVRRLRPGARQGRAAAGGPRLRDAGRRRDHRQVHAVAERQRRLGRTTTGILRRHGGRTRGRRRVLVVAEGGHEPLVRALSAEGHEADARLPAEALGRRRTSSSSSARIPPPRCSPRWSGGRTCRSRP